MTAGYPTTFADRRQSIIDQAKDAEAAAEKRVERVAADLAEARMTVADKERELKQAESELHRCEAYVNEQQRRGTHVPGFAA